MLTTDMIEEIGAAFNHLFEDMVPNQLVWRNCSYLNSTLRQATPISRRMTNYGESRYPVWYDF